MTLTYKKTFVCSALVLIAGLFSGCDQTPQAEQQAATPVAAKTPAPNKAVVYQVFTRLYGNQNATNKRWGTAAENGVGKFSDFTDTALQSIRDLGVTHLWYTGVPHHAVINDYSAYGIGNDDPDVVKGRAGSPYAVKDYYSVNPDLADDPAQRLQEFEALIARTHKHQLKVIIDIVPNHVARNYQSLGKPDGVVDFGAADDSSVEYARDNDFYYVVGEAFRVPQARDGYQPLGGEAHPLSDGLFQEDPAKWTGNGSRLAQPDANDWYETVKVNYGVRPDGSYDFPRLPEALRNQHFDRHADFWADKDVPASWVKFRDITQFWLNKGVDGFRYDMAEMVPVEFWSYLNSAIKRTNPDAFLLAEVYNPKQYRNYIQLGLMDYLYDKVEMYDTLKAIIQGSASTDAISPIVAGLSDIEQHMLHFLENHDEQRIASADFAGSANNAKPAMVISALISSAPTLIYFAQELGEAGDLDAGFGKPTRTSIFDYVGVPSQQRFMNGGKFDGGQSTPQELALRNFYQRLLNLALQLPALNGEFFDLHGYNRANNPSYSNDENAQAYSFIRWNEQQKLIVATNFSRTQSLNLRLQLPSSLLEQWSGQQHGKKPVELLNNIDVTRNVEANSTYLIFELAPLQSAAIEF